MRCQDAFEALSARFDGELDAEELPALEAHLASCVACRSLQEQLAPVARRLRGAAVEQPHPSLALQARIANAVRPKKSPRRVPVVFGFAFIGAAAALGLFAVAARARTNHAADSALAGAHELREITGTNGSASVEPCRHATELGFVASACSEGGLPRAKLAMKAMVKRARDRGLDLTCRSCHRDEQTYDLNDDARTRLAEVLAATRT